MRSESERYRKKIEIKQKKQIEKEKKKILTKERERDKPMREGEREVTI